MISFVKLVTAQRLNSMPAVSACASSLANEKDDMPTYVGNKASSGLISQHAEL